MSKRSPLLRRTVYLTALLSTIAVFALSLNAIARTQRHVPGGAAAPITREFERVRDGHHCHRGDGLRQQQQEQAPASSGREV
jgi:hypothetical protein